MGMTAKFWGVQSSIPVGSPPTNLSRSFLSLFEEFFHKGYSNPSDIEMFLSEKTDFLNHQFSSSSLCVELRSGDQQLIINGGSGIKRLGDSLRRNSNQKPQRLFHILITHANFERLIGLPFFAPIFTPGNEVHFYSADPELLSSIQYQFKRPYFPVSFENLMSDLHIHALRPEKSFLIGDIEITPLGMNPQNRPLSYQIKIGNQRFFQVCDHQNFTKNSVLKEELLHSALTSDLMFVEYPHSPYDVRNSDSNNKVKKSTTPNDYLLQLAFDQAIKNILMGPANAINSEEQREQWKREIEQQLYRFQQNQAHAHQTQWSFVYEGQTIAL